VETNISTVLGAENEAVGVARRPPAARASVRIPADAIYRWVGASVACGVLVLLAAIVFVLLRTAWPAFGRVGFGFFTGTVWNSSTNVYGALPFIVGTLLTTALALLIAVPVSLAIAILMTEYAPRRLAESIGIVVDVAAGVPTIVFGAWALIMLIPWLRDTAEPAIQAVLGWLPIFATPPIGYLTGQGIFAASLVLAAMVFPTIVAVSRNSFLATPQELRESSLALGATRWETATRVVMRQARPGLIGAVILACGRALGETMAVVYVIGTVPQIPHSLFDSGYTISAELFTQIYGGASFRGSLYTAVLYELGLILLALSLLTSLLSRLLTWRLFATQAGRAL
jgi:phosphate transport system permease protein